MRLLPYIVSMLISASGLVAGSVLLVRKKPQQAALLLAATTVIAGTVAHLWRP